MLKPLSFCALSVLPRGGIAFDTSEEKPKSAERKTPCPDNPDRASMPGGAIVAPRSLVQNEKTRQET